MEHSEEQVILREIKIFGTIIVLSLFLALIVNVYGIHLPRTGLVRALVDWILYVIEETSYLGVFFLMILESALLPVPSEIIMPFAGYLAYLGHMDIVLIIAAGTLGNLVGSLIAYYLGLYGGRNFVIKYGKYLLMRENHLKIAEKLFNDYGEIIIFVGRMLPAIRTVISFPAGVGKMDLRKFMIYTILGSIPWNTMLAYSGFLLGENWENIISFFEKTDLIFVVALIIIIVLFIKYGE